MPFKDMEIDLVTITAVFFVLQKSSSLAILIDKFRFSDKIFSIHSAEYWTNTIKICSDIGEKLATMEDLRYIDSAVLEQHNLKGRELWTNNAYIHTPFITKTGCYHGKDNVTISADLKVYGPAPVAVCYAYCSRSRNFALYGTYCICNPSEKRDFDLGTHCSSTNTINRFEVFKASSNTEYEGNTEDIEFKLWMCRINGDFKVEPRYHSVFKSKMTQKQYHAVCLSDGDIVQPLSERFSDWDSSNEACLGLTGQPLATTLNETHCHSLNRTIKNVLLNAIFITGTRTYYSDIIMKDINASGVSFNHIWCKTFAWVGTFNSTEDYSSKLVRCNEGQKNFICIKGMNDVSLDSGGIYLIIVVTLVVISLVVITISIFIFMKRRYPSILRKDKEKEEKPDVQATSDYKYDHTESNDRIPKKTEHKAVDISVNEDKSHTLPKEDKDGPDASLLSDRSCNSFVSAFEQTPLPAIPAGNAVLCLDYANMPVEKITFDCKDDEYANM